MGKILVVCAHSDDETAGMGGTLKKLSEKHHVRILYLTDSVMGRRQPGSTNKVDYEISPADLELLKKEIIIKQEQTRKACSILGVKDIKFLDFPNVELDTIPLLKVIKVVEREIQDFEPETIFTCHYNDINIDHRIAYEATITAARPLPESNVNSIFSFELLGDTDWRKPHKFNANMFIDISEEIYYKTQALKAYESEIRKAPHPRSEEMIMANARRWGGISGYHYAEPFETIFQRKKAWE